jgi:hypothetical protein
VSADNGIYILATDKTEGDLEKSEYRVAYAQGIDNIYGEFDGDCGAWKGNDEYIKELFRESEIFEDLNSALDKADQIALEYDYLEDGICVITEFHNKGHLFR